MSSVYVLEPPTRGKVVLHTTYGPLDIELWPKEAPKTVRNFVQLCLECYYDNTVFHRVIKSFLVQGGDPTGSGSGGESIYGGVFPDEFHSRLRFKHRGLVASANAGSPDSNGSQFFITLDRCDWLDKKNTIFGKVTGDSVFNLLHLGEVETDKNDRPLDPPPRILSVEVLWNPFDDIVTRKVSGKLSSSSLADDVEGKDQKKKGVKKLNLLSFGEEAEEEEKELATVKEKIKSSHDVLNDPRLLKEPSEKEQNLSEVKDMQRFFREALTKRDAGEKEADTILSDINDLTDDEDEAKFDERMRLQILKKRKELGDIPTVEKSSTEKKSLKERRSSPPRVKSEDLESIPKKEKLSLKKKGIGSEARAEQMAKADGDLQLLGQAEQERYMHKQRKRRVQGREEETLARLQNFKKALSSNTVQNSEPGVGDEEGESGWFSNKLKFLSDPSNKDAMSRKDDPNEYLVHDPLLEKGKEKFNKTQAKLKRREREWAGKSLT
ncbi:peptidyl-prolyl cis-trans isomerase CYP57 [Aristolochia californica]|uniref:peptidyl-prolyl cis-trans isomerase CYP57 n=1 Tax=Aristolochia californica TaxID=171875 RepID=UPI0035D8035E